MREFINPNQIGNIIISNIKNKNNTEYSQSHLKKSSTIFVFPTNIAKKTWIHWLINPNSGNKTKIKAIESDRFLEWKTFKEKYLFSPVKNRKPAAPELRQLFAYDYINNNKDKLSNILKYPEFGNKKLAKLADPFSSWLGNNIRELHYWKQRIENKNIGYGKQDIEDIEYNEIYESYKDFLNRNNLYEPDWVDFSINDKDYNEPFNYIKLNDSSNKFIIFFPETIDDFNEYKSYLESQENITLYYLDKKICNEKFIPDSIHYADSRTELRITMLKIIDIVNSGKADWSEIGLTVPDIETYKPYIKREFDLYNIPYVFKQGESIINNKFGRIFEEIYDCYYSYFSFKSVSTLLLDNFINWKKSASIIIDKLIAEGKRMRCLCSYMQDEKNKIDIWEKSFEEKIKNTNGDLKEQYIELLNFYKNFKEIIISFFPEDPNKNNFKNIKLNWENFLQKYTEIPANNNLNNGNTETEIISEVCMEILNNLIHLENKYGENGQRFNIKSPFEFYLQQLRKKLFTADSKSSKGVNIIMYTNSAAAYFKYQFVINCSQKNLSYENKKLTFLNSLKREKLRLEDTIRPYPEADDKIIKQAEAFIYLYNKADCIFSSAQKTFDGYEIPYYILNSKDITPDEVRKLEKKEDKTDINKLNKWFEEWNNKDYIISEKNYILNNSKDKLDNIKLSQNQIESFNKWKKVSENLHLEENTNYELNEKLKNRIDSILIKQDKTGNKDFCISPRGSLENYFPCPRVWLFKKFFNLSISNETVTLFNNFDMGNYHHKIMEHFMDYYKNNNKTLPCYTDDIFSRNVDDITEDCTDEILTTLDNAIEKTYTTLDDDFKDSLLTIDSLKAQKDKDKKDLILFLQHFLLNYKGKKSNSITGVGNCSVYDTEKYCIKPFKKNNLCWNYNGSIDSIFKTPENELIIVDYKNSFYSIPDSKDFNASKDNTLKDFQMAIYYYMIYDNNNIHKMQYFSFYPVQNKTFHRNYTISDINIETLHEYSELFVKSVKAGKFSSFNPYPLGEIENNKFSIDKDICNKCGFKKICRTTFSIGNKTITK